MTDKTPPAQEPSAFRAVLRPHRSLGPKGFLVLMAILSLISFTAGLVFFFMGAWPVFGFLGLDVFLVYLAFRANYRAANAYEQVTVTASELTVRKVTPLGRVRQEWTANPLWVRLQQDIHEEFGVERLFLISRGERLAIAGFLGPEEKKSFAMALSQALFEAKRGATRTPA